MEDELSELRLESSKFKTELISERSTWEIKLSEMQSRLNEVSQQKNHFQTVTNITISSWKKRKYLAAAERK